MDAAELKDDDLHERMMARKAAERAKVDALTAEVARLTKAVEAATWAKTRLTEHAKDEQAGRVQGGGREWERRVWGAFSDFDAAIRT